MSDQNANAGGSGNSNQQPQNQTPDPNKEPEWAKAIRESADGMGKSMRDLLAFAKESQAKVQNQQPITQEEIEDAADEVLTEAQLEAMPRRQFMDRLLLNFNKQLEKTIKPLQDQIQSSQNLTVTNIVTQQIEAFAAKTPDFNDWGEELKEITKTNPGLHISRAYAVVRAENPQKAAEMDKKYKKEEKGEDGEKGGKKPAARQRSQNSAPFSMSPSGENNPPPNRKMGAKDAATKAWEDTIAQMGNPFE